MEKAFRCEIIAEVASNHSGNLAIAKKFIQVSARLGVDYVKFQSSRYEDLVRKNDPQAEWIKRTSLSEEDHLFLIDVCRRSGVSFLTTCFSLSRVSFLGSLGLRAIKVASPDLLSFAMIEKLAQFFPRIFISTGMHSIKEIKAAIKFLLTNKIPAVLLYTVSLYPTPLEKCFMRKFLWLKDHYPLVGYSNHTATITPAKFAMDHGASVIEAHMKLSDSGPGRVTPWDISPSDFSEIIKYRAMLREFLGNAQWLASENYLFPEERKAKRRFVGRWGDNV